MFQTLNKYITLLDHPDNILLVLSRASSDFPLFSSSTVIGTPAGIGSASISLVFLVAYGITKMFLKSMRKTALLAKSKLNSIEKMISKGLIDFDNSHNEFQLPINYEQFLFILD